jgi:biotin operon repressor
MLFLDEVGGTAAEHTDQAAARTCKGAACSGSTTADLLGISRKTLWENMKRLQIANGFDR